MKELKEKLDIRFKPFCLNNNSYKDFDLNNVALFKSGENKNFKYPADSEEYTLSKNSKALSSVFGLGFSMWEAGKKNKEIYETIYAFPSDFEDKNNYSTADLFSTSKEMIPINGNKAIARNFINTVCNKAIQLHKQKGIDAIANSKFFITGEIGVGKTTFLNYLFSTYHEQLHKKNVIWVRVDLSKHYHNIKKLKESLEFQIARIYRQHYESDLLKYEDEFKEFTSDYFKHLGRMDTLKKKEFDKAIDDYFSPFVESKKFHYNEKLQVAIKEFVEKKYGVIYIYDGLDEVRIDDNEDYNAKLNEVIDILNSEKFNGVYIFVMRFESQYKLLKKFYKKTEINQLSNLRGYGKSFKILPPTLEEIIEKRLELIISRWEYFIEKKSDIIIAPDIEDFDIDKQIKGLIEEFQWLNSDTIQHYFIVFKIYLTRALSFEERTISLNELSDSPYQKLENLIGKNYRLLLQILSGTNTCFLETLELLKTDPKKIAEIGINIINEKIGLENYSNYKKLLYNILSKHYRIIPSLLRRKLSYVHPFKYVLLEGKIEKQIVLESTKFPYIFNLFYSINDHQAPPSKFCILGKVRILQRLLKKSDHLEEIKRYVKSNFFYTEAQINYGIEELIQGDYIAIKPEEFENKVMYFLVITQCGRNSLNKLINDFNYIRIILDDSLLPKEKRYDFQDPRPELYIDNKSQWALYQIKRIANFINLIHSVESLEYKSNKRLKPENWLIAPKMYEHFLETVTKIIHNDDPKLETINKIF